MRNCGSEPQPCRQIPVFPGRERKRDLPEGIVPIDILDHGDGGKEAVEDSGHRRELGMVPTLALQLLLVTNCTKTFAGYCWQLSFS